MTLASAAIFNQHQIAADASDAFEDYRFQIGRHGKVDMRRTLRKVLERPQHTVLAADGIEGVKRRVGTRRTRHIDDRAAGRSEGRRSDAVDQPPWCSRAGERQQ